MNAICWLAPLAPTRIVLEATGGYEANAVAPLSLAGLLLGAVDPRRGRDFAKALGRRAQTDAIDAAVFAEFAEKVCPPVRPLPTAEARKWQAILARRRQLIEMRTMASNRLQETTDGTVRRSRHAVLRTLEREIGQADRELDAAIRECPAWAAKDELLPSISGIGPVVRRTLLADRPELGTMTRETAAALVGWSRGTTTAVGSGVSGSSAGVGRRCGACCTWRHMRRSRGTGCCGRSRIAWQRPGRLRR